MKLIKLHQLQLAIYDPVYKNLPEELSISVISNELKWNDAKTRSEEIKNQLVSGRFNHLYYKELMKANRNFTISAQDNPDNYLRPFDIIERKIDTLSNHFAIYLGDRKVCHISREDGAAKRDQDVGLKVRLENWEQFLHGQSEAKCHHPFALFKNNQQIIKHLRKVLENNYGQSEYNLITKNCEHFVNLIIYGLPHSEQVDGVFDNITKFPFLIPFRIYYNENEKNKIKKVLEIGEGFFDSLEKKES